MRLETFSPAETEQLGHAIGRLLSPSQVVALIGELAAGKTTLIKGICAGLGVVQTVDSPTFTMINEYAGRIPVYHLDCYREQRITEWLELGIMEYLYGNGVTLIEWAEHIESLLPDGTLYITLEHDLSNANHRWLQFSGDEKFIQRLRELTQDMSQVKQETPPC